MGINKGGRGKKKPYETVTMRIPLPIKEMVEAMRDDFESGKLLEDVVTEAYKRVNWDKVMDKTVAALRQKKTTKVMIKKLVSSLFNVDESQINL